LAFKRLTEQEADLPPCCFGNSRKLLKTRSGTARLFSCFGANAVNPDCAKRALPFRPQDYRKPRSPAPPQRFWGFPRPVCPILKGPLPPPADLRTANLDELVRFPGQPAWLNPGRTKHETARMPAKAVRSCRVTITDLEGISHTVEVTAETLYEAVALGLVAFTRQRLGCWRARGISARSRIGHRNPG
jgi:hypothetical protein